MESKKATGAGLVASVNPLAEREGSSARQPASDSFSLRRRSQSRSSLDSSVGPRTSTSCVNRQTSGEDCARQRFIVWAAVKRNRSVRMAPSARLRCPLLRCGEQFEHHELMLRHLTDCRHFASGEYVCYECMRVEKFNDSKCKCCLGHPTKRRRIINMAKNFFSTLGHKSRKDGAFDIDQDDFPAPPPSYESLGMEHQVQHPPPPPPQGGSLEMGGNEILELDSVPLPPAELNSVNYAPDHMDCEPLNPADTAPNSMFPAIPDFFPLPVHGAFLDHAERAPSPSSSRPSLALDTQNIGPKKKIPRTTYLSPSSSLRSNNSSQVISPISADSVGWAGASTIDTSLTSPITPFSPDGVESSALSRENSCKMPKDLSTYPSNNERWFDDLDHNPALQVTSYQDEGNAYTLDNVSELPGDDPMTVPRFLGSDPFMFSFDPKENYSWSSSIDTEVNVMFANGGLGSLDTSAVDEQQESAGQDATALVATTWSALQEHITSSFTKTAHLSGNALVRRLASSSTKDVASIGLATLRNIVSGVDSDDPFEFLCLVHVIYAFSLIIHEDDLASRCARLFRQALAYRGFLSPTSRDAYIEVVQAIWKPAEVHSDDADGLALSRSSSLRGKDPEVRTERLTPLRSDPLIHVAQNFLDDLEYSVLNEDSNRSPDAFNSTLYRTHISDLRPNASPSNAFIPVVDYITKSLAQQYTESGGQSLSHKLKLISQRVGCGYVATVRKLELELIQAGKSCMSSVDLFDDFIPQVRQLCDPIYPTSCHPRVKYHTLGLALVESMIRGFQETSSANDLPDRPEDPDPLVEFLEPFDSTFASEPNKDQLAEFTMPMTLGLSLDTSLDLSNLDFSIELPEGDENDVEAQVLAPESRNAAITSNLAPSKTTAHEPPNSASISADDEFQDPSSLAADFSHTDPGSPSEGGASNGGQKSEAHSVCDICGYRPKGDPQWFKGSMAKHKKLQHLSAPKIYRCPFPGCTSAYKNRRDNLRQHQLEKGHFVDGADGSGRRTNKRKRPVE